MLNKYNKSKTMILIVEKIVMSLIMTVIVDSIENEGHFLYWNLGWFEKVQNILFCHKLHSLICIDFMV